MTLECWRKNRRESQNLKPQRARRTAAESAENGCRERRDFGNIFKCNLLIGEHEGDGDLGSDGDFVAVDGEGLVAPLANRVDGGVG
jgi:hypothetical protein